MYDGDSPFAPEIAAFTGSSTLPDYVVSTGPDMFITFLSDETETRSGFKIWYSAGENSFCYLGLYIYI